MNKEILPNVRKASLKKVIDLCHANLFTNNGKQVLQYLVSERGLSEKTIRTFKLGAYPQYADVITNLIGSYTAFKCGLVGFDEEGMPASKFCKHNIIIPIFNTYGEPTAIMGRSQLTKDELEAEGLPKYTNSLFKKRQNLFGLSVTKDAIMEKEEVFIVEGNFDVIVAWQNGLKNIVAASSASLSVEQFVLASRYALKVNLLFDNDKAGQDGVERALKKYGKEKGISICKALLPDGPKDIDEYFSKKCKERIKVKGR